MSSPSKRSTVYFEPEVHQALRLKAALTHRSVSDLVNEAVRNVLQEDQEDLEACETRISEPTITYEELLNDLKAHGKL
jgi:plasmid stability protein